jgi:colicin import membrane protein
MTVVVNDNFFAENWKYLFAAAVLHIAVGLLFVVSINTTRQTVVPSQLAIKAIVIDHTAQRLKREKEKAEADRLAREQAEAEQKAREKAEADRVEKEQQTKREEEQRQAAAADQKRKADEQRKADEKQAIARKKADDDKKRVAEIKAKQDEKQKHEREAREQAQRESELKRQLADEEGLRQAENSSAAADYYASIVNRVQNVWIRPPTAKPGLECYVTLTQGAGGSVLKAEIGQCNGDNAVKESIRTAVYGSTPLPLPTDMRLFKRQLTFRFIPRE